VKRVLLIDDEPGNVAYLKLRLEAELGPSLEVSTLGNPSEIGAHLLLGGWTHAVVDLSFGSLDRSPGQRIVGTGIDAIDEIVASFPTCRIVVATRFDGDALMSEMVVAIRQTWPSIMFLHKADSALDQRLVDFVRLDSVNDNAVFMLDLAGIRPLSPQQIHDAVKSCLNRKAAVSLLLALSGMHEQPTTRALAAHCIFGEQYAKNVLQSVGDALVDIGALRLNEERGIKRLWLWARARSAILRRALAPLA
jgi:hypothetical protein